MKNNYYLGTEAFRDRMAFSFAPTQSLTSLIVNPHKFARCIRVLLYSMAILYVGFVSCRFINCLYWCCALDVFCLVVSGDVAT